ncbi:MAG TPA: lysylphosphatidylglycerol synthase transmembrane domain-containing protein [Candidatus Tectomicrobia bacterium]
MKWQVWLGLLLSAVFGLLTLSQVNLHQLVAALRSAHYPLLLLAAVLQVSTLLVRARRWQYLFEPIQPMRVLPLLSATAVGFLANMVLPAHAGEVVRAYVLSRRENLSAMTVLTTIVVERVMDIVAMLLILLAVLVFANIRLELIPATVHLKTVGYVCLLAGVGLVGGLWFFRSQLARVLQTLSGCLAMLPQPWQLRLRTTWASFVLGLQVFRSGRHVVAMCVLSILLWSMVAFSNVCVFYAFELRLPFIAAFLVLGMQMLGVTIPAAPGFIGTYHAAVVAGLAVFEVATELALSMAIVMHATFFFPFLLIGLLFLWWESLSLRDLRAANILRRG